MGLSLFYCLVLTSINDYWKNHSFDYTDLCRQSNITVRGILQAKILKWVPFPFPGDLPDLGIELGSPVLQADYSPSEPPGKSICNSLPKSFVVRLEGFPGSSAGKKFALKEGDTGLIPGSGKSPREGTDCPLQYSWASLVAQLVKRNLSVMWETWV